MNGQELFDDLLRAAKVISPLTLSEDQFRATIDAFRAQDTESFQRLLCASGLLDRCELGSTNFLEQASGQSVYDQKQAGLYLPAVLSPVIRLTICRH